MSENKVSLNPNATSFVPNPNAKPFVPRFANTNIYNGGGNISSVNLAKNQMEARCEQAIEILSEATELCDQMNNPDSQNHLNDDDAQFNDDELFEMLQMQEECRLEMMKYYIQAQNPNLFEEVYYGVSYGDGPQQQQYEQQPYVHYENELASDIDNLNLTSDDAVPQDRELDDAMEFIKTQLNPNVSEFKPKSFQ